MSENKKEYFIVRDESGNAVGKKEVKSRKLSSNTNAFIVNGDMVFSVGEYFTMQEECENLNKVD